MHIVSGQDYRAIPCKDKDKKTQFKQEVMATGLQQCVRMAAEHPNAQAATQGKHVLFAGDMNLSSAEVEPAIKELEEDAVESTAMHHVVQEGSLQLQEGKERDFFLSSLV